MPRRTRRARPRRSTAAPPTRSARATARWSATRARRCSSPTACASRTCASTCSNDIAGCRYVGWNPMTSPTAELRRRDRVYRIRRGLRRGRSTARCCTTTSPAGLPIARFPTAAVATGAIGLDDRRRRQGLRTHELEHGLRSRERRVGCCRPALAATYTAMWASDTGDIFLGGNVGRLAHFDGTSWSETTFGGATANVRRDVGNERDRRVRRWKSRSEQHHHSL